MSLEVLLQQVPAVILEEDWPFMITVKCQRERATHVRRIVRLLPGAVRVMVEAAVTRLYRLIHSDSVVARAFARCDAVFEVDLSVCPPGETFRRIWGSHIIGETLARLSLRSHDGKSVVASLEAEEATVKTPPGRVVVDAVVQAGSRRDSANVVASSEMVVMVLDRARTKGRTYFHLGAPQSTEPRAFWELGDAAWEVVITFGMGRSEL
jgi:hypothetical protein